ncbi:hypothetical protein GCM10029964_068310 [Kibdelosporangium lantanae]
MAPLTWSQIGVWGGMVSSGKSVTVDHTAELPSGTTVDDVAEMLRFAVSRHQTLRTRLLFDADGQAMQNCSETGEVPLEVFDAGDADPADTAETISRQYQRKNFDYVTEWPIRTAVVRKDGVPTHLVLVILHTAIDLYGLAILLDDIAGRDPETGAAPRSPARNRSTRPGGRPALPGNGRTPPPCVTWSGSCARCRRTGSAHRSGTEPRSTGGSPTGPRRPCSPPARSPRGPGATRRRCCWPASPPRSPGPPATPGCS